MDKTINGEIIMYKANEIANWFLHNVPNMTNKKLQKLLYYAYSWYLVLNNESVDQIDSRLFENRFEAWVHGAVYPDIYYEYRRYGSAVIDTYNGELASFSPDEIDILNQIVEVYGEYTGNELESICHQESPWINARNGLPAYTVCTNSITDEDIFECYSQRLN